jgi:hypothetical protein
MSVLIARAKEAREIREQKGATAGSGRRPAARSVRWRERRGRTRASTRAYVLEEQLGVSLRPDV